MSARGPMEHARFPVKWTLEGCTLMRFMNLPQGVLILYPDSTSPEYVYGHHIIYIEPYGDADLPRPGYYWESIPPGPIPMTPFSIDASDIVNPTGWTVTGIEGIDLAGKDDE